MKTPSIILIYICLCLTTWGQQTRSHTTDSVNFDIIIEHFKTPKYPIGNLRVEISDNPIAFHINEIALKKPIDDKFPVSYSVIYQDRLISLFDPGVFVCHSLSTMNRDSEFEKILNTKKFQYHWLLDNKLVGISDGKYYVLNLRNNWVEYLTFVPFTHQPKLFEDSSYISFFDDHGEWGGTVYFYNKTTEKIFFTEANSAKSILKKDNKYYVLSSLGHAFGFARLTEIANPDKLSQIEFEKVNKTVNGEALGYTDKSNASKKIFNWQGIEILSSFIYLNKTIYLVYWNDVTFLAEIENNIIKVVNPLLNKGIYSHNPIATSYGDLVLINMDFYGIAREREVSCIIIKNNKITKLDWK